MADEETAQMGDDARRTIAGLAADTLPRLIKRLTTSDLGELEVREDGWRIRLRRPIALSVAAQDAKGRTQSDRPRVAGGPPAAAHGERTTSSGRSGQSGRADSPRGSVTSPAVGYFSSRDGIANGSNVASGDVLGHVDVLGVRQEVVAPIDGVVAGLEVETGQAIEYGQRIARIEANVQ